MCIIAFKPHKVEPISKKVLKQCWNRNSDGAGYAYLAEGDDGNEFWEVKKGFMSWKKFWKSYSAEEFKKEHVYVCHFRIKSAGEINPGNTHPFPITDDYNTMTQLRFQSKHIVLHNGTCGTGDKGYSDTMVFIRNKIDALWKPSYKDERVWEILRDLISDTRDRWLILEPDHYHKFGNWQEESGVFYSNTSYKPLSTHTTNHYNSYNHTTTYQADEVKDEYVGLVDEDGNITWEPVNKDTIDADKIVMCPNCFEDEKLDESPFEGVGDTVCLVCGAVFNDVDAKIWMWDEDLRAKYIKEEQAKSRKTN